MMVFKKALYIMTLFLVLVSVIVVNFSASAAPSAKKQPKQKESLSTDVRFDGTNVTGQYQTALEAVSTVEADKLLDDLLGVRKHFKDRLKKMSKSR